MEIGFNLHLRSANLPPVAKGNPTNQPSKYKRQREDKGTQFS